MNIRSVCWLNGDSHTIGSELNTGELSYAQHVAKNLGFEVTENPAVGGGSNWRILRTTHSLLDQAQLTGMFPEFVLIGWSEVQRMDFWHKSRFRSIAAGEGFSHEIAKSTHPEQFETWKKFFDSGHREFTLHLAIIQQEWKFALHNRLNEMDIPHLFVDTCSQLLFKDHEWIGFFEQLPKYDWGGKYYNVYKRDKHSFMDWAKENNFPITEYHHANAGAHSEYGRMLSDYIIENKLYNRR